MQVKHWLKTWPRYFEAAARGEKTYEIRVDDRAYAVGDVVGLLEYDPKEKKTTARVLLRVITYGSTLDLRSISDHDSAVRVGIFPALPLALERGTKAGEQLDPVTLVADAGRQLVVLALEPLEEESVPEVR